MSVRIVLTATNYLVPRLIRWITGSQVSHAGIQFSAPIWGSDLMVEATFPKARFAPVEIARHNVVYDYECKFDTTASFKAINTLVGQWFDIEGLLIIGWIRAVWILFRRRIKVPHRNAKEQFCSELVARFLIAAKLPGTESWDPERITPEDIRQYCEQHPELFTRIL